MGEGYKYDRNTLSACLKFSKNEQKHYIKKIKYQHCKILTCSFLVTPQTHSPSEPLFLYLVLYLHKLCNVFYLLLPSKLCSNVSYNYSCKLIVLIKCKCQFDITWSHPNKALKRSYSGLACARVF